MEHMSVNDKNGLIIIDAQKGFINEYTQSIVKDIEQMQNKFEVVIATKFINKEKSPYSKYLHFNSFYEGSEETQLAFSPCSKATILDKHSYSCVTQEAESIINSYNLKQMYLCGLDTDACVLKTALDLFEKGIRPIILSQYCASSDGSDYHIKALDILKRNIGDEQIMDKKL